jgi:hypothetical protein
MKFVKLTPENVNMYIGYEILFVTKEISITKTIYVATCSVNNLIHSAIAS